jgi:hypothetical protein
MKAEPSLILRQVIAEETTKALRSGVPLEAVIATLVHHAERLQAALPVVLAVRDGERGGP